MKRLLGIAIAALAITMISGEAHAQIQRAFNFGVGLQSANVRAFGALTPAQRTLLLQSNALNRSAFGFGFNRNLVIRPRFEEPPYFAKFPPVYYNEIVSRNYGASPYAVPGGIMPVEGIVAVEPVKPTRVQNQFFKKDQGKTPKKVPALPSPSDKKDEINKKRVPWDKTTVKVIVNPYASPRMVNKK